MSGNAAAKDRDLHWMDFDGYRFTVGLAAFGQPLTECSCESFRINFQAGFHLTFPNGQSVVKFRRASEVAHTESVEPIQRARLALAVDYGIHS